MSIEDYEATKWEPHNINSPNSRMIAKLVGMVVNREEAAAILKEAWKTCLQASQEEESFGRMQQALRYNMEACAYLQGYEKLLQAQI